MQPFEYVALLTSIVIALGVTRILGGFGQVLRLWSEVGRYWVQTLWMANVLLWLLLSWWILYRWHTREQWTFFLFLFVLVSPVIAFLMSVLLVPEPLRPDTNLRNHFYANTHWFFALAALLPPVDAVDTMLKGRAHFVAQGPLYVATLFVIFVLCLIGTWTKSERFHAFFACFFFVYILVFISVNLRLLV